MTAGADFLTRGFPATHGSAVTEAGGSRSLGAELVGIHL